MKAKRAKITLNSIEDYVRMMNGLFGLTDREIDVLSEFIKEKLYREQNDIDANVHLFHHSVKKRIAKRLGKKSHHWINGYIMDLKKKGAIVPLGEEGKYRINKGIMPRGEDKVVIEINWNMGNE